MTHLNQLSNWDGGEGGGRVNIFPAYEIVFKVLSAMAAVVKRGGGAGGEG